MDAESIYQVLKHGTAAERQALGRALPPDPMRDLAAPLLGSERLSMSVVALGPLAIAYCNGAEPAVGAELAKALHRLAVELFEGTSEHGLLPTTLSALADNYVKACNLLGRSADAVAFADEYIPYYEKLGEPINLRSLKLGRIEAYLNLNRLDDVAKALEDPSLPGNPATDIELARLQAKVRALRETVFKNRPQSPAPAGPVDDEFVARAQAALAQATSGFAQEGKLKELIGGLAGAPRLDPNDPDSYRRLLDLLKAGESLLRRGGVSDSLLTIRARIREATAIFKLQAQPSHGELRKSLAELEHCLQWADANKDAELQNDALYGIYLCDSRLDAPSAAADALLRLRANLETARSAITDVTRRGGAFGAYPYLFVALCEKLYAAGRAPEMLEAIEASKGRGVADLLTRRSREAVADASIYGAVARLPDLCRKHAFHYVTYLVDDEQTYAVLVTSDGAVRAVTPVRLSRATIREAATPVTPETTQRLSPLIEWIEVFISDGTITPGGHLCIAPDDDLANVPFACLTVRGRPLAETVSTSRTHNAFHLAHVLDAPVRRPESYLGVVVAARQNVASPSWKAMRADLMKPIDRLAQSLPGERLEGEAASLEALTGRDLTRRIVHFSTHGMFPRKDPNGSPFEHSGLLLADGKSLPDTKAVDLKAVLTPRAVLERQLDLTGSHVSMMACVSGLSREGIGGDALGMEWAMIQAGAASVLSTHWDVSAQLAAGFLHTFYQHWLGVHESRAAALSATMAALRAAGGVASTAQSWAAFSLTGDWR